MFSNHFATPAYRDFSYPPVQTASTGPLRPAACRLSIRQQPHEALVTLEGKEKVRKPVDPPPILELLVNNGDDPQQQFLQNPYLFVCVSLFKADKDEAYHDSGDKILSGTLVSSLHRLKDISNKDGGFFVFGDISVKVQGTFRLHFSLYEFHKDHNEIQFLTESISDKFKVLLPKDFKGMEESTYLSRAFSDQGVRLRLRKEPRGVMGNKRAYPFNENVSNPPIRPNTAGEYSQSYEATPTSPNKRFKAPHEERKDSFPTIPSVTASPYTRQHSLPTSYGMGSFSGLGSTSYGMATAGTQPSYSVRPDITGHNSNTLYSNQAFHAPNAAVSVAASGAVSNSLPHYTAYSRMYPQYDQRNMQASSVDHSNFPAQFSVSDTPYLD